MVSKEAEYTSLREELIAHQSRRETVLSIGLAATVALIAVGIEQSSAYTLLLVLFILFAVHLQITDIHAGIQRIATYLRVAHEGEGSELRWETASYLIRRADLDRQGAKKMTPKKTPVFSSMEFLLLATGSATWVIAALFTQGLFTLASGIWLVSGFVWFAGWFRSWKANEDLHTMTLEEYEANRFREILGLSEPIAKPATEEEHAATK